MNMNIHQLISYGIIILFIIVLGNGLLLIQQQAII